MDRTLLRLSLPIIFGQMSMILVVFADNMMVGHYGTAELAAASFVNNIFGIALIFGTGFAFGLTPMISGAYAIGNRRRAGSLVRQSLHVYTGVGVSVCTVMLLLYALLPYFELPEELLPLIRPYYILQTLSLFMAVLFGSFKQFFDGAGRPALGMWVMLASNLLNIVGNYLLIFGKFGCPEWGLFGAGVATLGARIFTVVLLWSVFMLSKQRREEQCGFHDMADGGKYRRAIIRLGLPIAIQQGVEAGSFTIAVIFVGWLGSSALAAHQIVSVVTTLGFVIYYGFGSATTILISRFRAEGDMNAVRATVHSALKICGLFALAVVLIIFLSRHHIARLFTTDREVIAMTAITLLPVVLYQFGDVLQIIYANSLRGMEDVHYMARAAVLIHILLAPTLAYLMGFHLGLERVQWQLAAVWSAFPISLTTLGLVLRHRFRKLTC